MPEPSPVIREVLDKTGVGGAVEGSLHKSQGRAEGSRTAATSDVKSARAVMMLKVINYYIISGIYDGMFIRFGWVFFSFLFFLVDFWRVAAIIEDCYLCRINSPIVGIPRDFDRRQEVENDAPRAIHMLLTASQSLSGVLVDIRMRIAT